MSNSLWGTGEQRLVARLKVVYIFRFNRKCNIVICDVVVGLHEPLHQRCTLLVDGIWEVLNGVRQTPGNDLTTT